MKVLSLFDGISCGKLALDRAGINVSHYVACEIDKYAIQVSKANHKDIEHIGDVTKLTFQPDYFDLLIGGSPCQGFSFAGKGLNFEDERSKLFFEYVRILNEVKPEYFLLENVVMKQEFQDVISGYLGVKPIKINSSLLSAQNRERLYWTNILNVAQPEDKGIVLSDILETDYSFKLYIKMNKIKNCHTKAGCLHGTANAAGNHSQMDVIVKDNEVVPLTSTGRIDIHINPNVRRYNIVECERLQTLPDGYTKSVSPSQAHKQIINGWTVDVIAHILSFI